MLDNDRALQIYLKNKDQFQGMPESEAISLIRRTAGILVGGAPGVTAPPVASALAAAAPAPVPMAAPVPTPAPLPEGDVVPASETEATAENPYQSPQQVALRAFDKANPQTPAVVPVKGAPRDYVAEARQQANDSKRRALAEGVAIAEETTLDPKVQKILDDRLLQYGAELAQVNPDKQRAIWMSVAQAGLKMAQSQSPYFMQALASGMEAGLEGYSEAKANAAEKKARLQDAKENLVLKSIDLRNQAIRDAVAANKDARATASDEAALRKDTLGGIVLGETAGETIKSVGLGNLLTTANIANTYSTIRSRAATDALAARAATAGGSALGAAYKSGIASEAAYGRDYAEKAMENSDLTPDDPGYTKAFSRKVAEGRTIFRNSNPQWNAISNKVEGVTTLKGEEKVKKKPPPEKPSLFSRLNPFD